MLAPFWRAAARIASRPAVTAWLIRRAQRTPYVHITGPDGSVYMERYWLFNAYPPESSGKRPWWEFPISIRLHRILRADDDRGHLHDHPWNARTMILDGWYIEEREGHLLHPKWMTTIIHRQTGDTAALRFGEYHRITRVSPGGVWTLFITGRYRGTWGFDVNGRKVPWREFLGLEPKK